MVFALRPKDSAKTESERDPKSYDCSVRVFSVCVCVCVCVCRTPIPSSGFHARGLYPRCLSHSYTCCRSLASDLPNPNRVFNFKAQHSQEKERWMDALARAGAGRM
jgi:hypothetical protein